MKKSKLLKSFYVFIYLLLPIIAQAQIVITGKVSGKADGPLIGASIIVKGSTIGTITDFDGKFVLNVPNEQAELRFSYLGYINKSIVVHSNRFFNIELELNQKALEGVVVIGYGQVKKSDVSGAVASISSKDISGVFAPSTSDLLRGRAAGVYVNSPNGKPGTGAQITIRGVQSIQASGSPLIVVDGIQGADLNSINPSDIDHLEILKDAASCSIYGSAGANGVILVTTKKGKIGKPKFVFESKVGVKRFDKYYKMMNARDSYNYFKELSLTGDKATQDAFKNVFSDKSINNLVNPTLGRIDTLNMVDNDWQKRIFTPAVFQQYSLSISGGNENNTYMNSLSLTNDAGILKPSNYQSIVYRLNMETKLGKKVTLNTNFSYNYATTVGVKDDGTGYDGGLMMSSLWYPRFIPERDPNNPDRFFINPLSPNTDNPLATVKSREDSYSMNNGTQGRLSLNIDIWKGLKSQTNAIIGLGNSTGRDYISQLHTYVGREQGGMASTGSSTNISIQAEQLFMYDFTSGKHQFNSMIGGILSDYTGYYMMANASGFPGDNLHYVNASATKLTASNQKTQTRKLSSIARVGYIYDDKYIVQGNVRLDASSRFGPSNRTALFPSLSAAWKIHHEGFIKDNISWLSELKLRGSYGNSGNDGIGDYAYLDIYGSGGPGSPVQGLYNDQELNTDMTLTNVLSPGVGPLQRSNYRLGWERVTEYNLGIDIGLFNNRLMFSPEYYVRKADQLLYNKPLPSSTGFSSYITNIAKVNNTGLDLSLNSKNIVSNSFTWETTFTFSFNQNKVDELIAGQQILFNGGEQANVPGYPIWGFWGYKTDGLYKDNDFTIDAEGKYVLDPKYPKPLSAVEPGDIKYVNTNSLLTTPDSYEKIDRNDITYLGSPNPPYLFSLNNKFEYKNWDFTIFLQGVSGNKKYNVVRMWVESMNKFFNTTEAMKERWPYNKESGIPRANMQDKNNNVFSDRWLEDGSYLRVKDIILGYNLPTKALKYLGISNFRAYLSAQNMFTLTNYTGLDPEGGAVDGGSNPQYKTVVVGINFAF